MEMQHEKLQQRVELRREILKEFRNQNSGTNWLPVCSSAHEAVTTSGWTGGFPATLGCIYRDLIVLLFPHTDKSNSLGPSASGRRVGGSNPVSVIGD